MSLTAVWCNGALVEHLSLAPDERGLTLGDGVFDTLAVVKGKPLWRAPHLARLAGAAEVIGIPFDLAAVEEAMAAVLARSAADFEVLRLTLTRGAGGRGLAGETAAPTVLVTLTALSPRLLFQPVPLATSRITRNAASVTARFKTTSYADAIAAAREAKDRGAEEALMLNTEGNVASASIANVFLVKGSALITPGLDQAIIPGTMRQMVLNVAGLVGYTTEERAVTPQEVVAADGVFLTNSLRFIRPVSHVDGTALAQADLSRLETALCRFAEKQCGIDPRALVEAS